MLKDIKLYSKSSVLRSRKLGLYYNVENINNF